MEGRRMNSFMFPFFCLLHSSKIGASWLVITSIFNRKDLDSTILNIHRLIFQPQWWPLLTPLPICCRLQAAAWSTFRVMLGYVKRRGCPGCRVVWMFESSDPLTKAVSLFWGCYLSWWKVVGRIWIDRPERQGQTAESRWTKSFRADVTITLWLDNRFSWFIVLIQISFYFALKNGYSKVKPKMADFMIPKIIRDKF